MRVKTVSRVLNADFFCRPTLIVARDLLGKVLVKGKKNSEVRLEIFETEAYDGPEDKASHAQKGKTLRNAPMFECGGIFYVYLVYGMHNMLNVVTSSINYPSAVLIRGAGDLDGPGKLTKFLGVDRSISGRVVGKNTGLWIEDSGIKVSQNNIQCTPRIGVSFAGEDWANRPYRFVWNKL